MNRRLMSCRDLISCNLSCNTIKYLEILTISLLQLPYLHCLYSSQSFSCIYLLNLLITRFFLLTWPSNSIVVHNRCKDIFVLINNYLVFQVQEFIKGKRVLDQELCNLVSQFDSISTSIIYNNSISFKLCYLCKLFRYRLLD